MKILTQYIRPPIPIRTSDWLAWDDDTADIDTPTGVGRTQEEAIRDLLEQLGYEEVKKCKATKLTN